MTIRHSSIILTAFTIASLFLVSNVLATDSAIDNINVSIPESCNLSTSSGSGQTYNVQVANGQYKDDIGKTRLTVFCNTNDTFAIYTVGYSNDTIGTTDMITTTSGATNILTGTATSGNTSNWAMKIETITGSGTDVYTPTILNSFDNFTSVPSTYTKIAEVASTTTGKTVEGAIDATYQVYISPNQQAGNYTGKVLYTVIHPASEVPTNFNDAYAAASKAKVNGYYTMQDMDASICDAVNIFDEPSQTQLIDARDNKLYYVAKLKDGGCWMTQNLDHDISTSFAYTPDNTDIPANWTPDKPTYTTNTTTWDSNNTGHSIQQSYDSGDKIWDGNPSSSTSITISNMTQGTNQHYHLGNYYNWGAAVAMNDTSAYTTDNTDVNQSICPKGWTLPKSGNITTAGSFQYLVNQYNWTSNNMSDPNMWATPLYFSLAGYWDVLLSRDVAYSGTFWSSVVRTSSRAYALRGNYDGSVTPSYNSYSYRNAGFSVRCVARQAGSTPGIKLADITTMQQMTSSICASSAVGDTATLTDTRDSKTYVVKKLADNRCWMVQNLRLGGSSAITLTSADSNVTANFTLEPSTDSFGTTNDAAGINVNRMHDNGNTWLDGSTVQNTGTPPSQTQYIGNYYNWYTATAGSGTYAMSTRGDNATQSICPKGWRLPTGDAIDTNTGNGELQQLYDAYGNHNSFISATNAVLSGSWYGSYASYQGSYGDWWSRTAHSDADGFRLSFGSSSVNPQANTAKRAGLSVRCIAE